MGDLSANFSKSEFECKCGRRHVETPPVDRTLIEVLQRLRDRGGRSLSIVSGIRCSAHNRRVGGAPNSQHLLGRAADISPGRFRVEEALAAGARGVGHRNGWVVHLDTRRGPVVTFKD